jgi:hypothetical protein
MRIARRPCLKALTLLAASDTTRAAVATSPIVAMFEDILREDPAVEDEAAFVISTLGAQGIDSLLDIAAEEEGGSQAAARCLVGLASKETHRAYIARRVGLDVWDVTRYLNSFVSAKGSD